MPRTMLFPPHVLRTSPSSIELYIRGKVSSLSTTQKPREAEDTGRV